MTSLWASSGALLGAGKVVGVSGADDVTLGLKLVEDIHKGVAGELSVWYGGV